MLELHRSERADLLVEALGDILAGAPLGDPLTAEVVAVPTRGVERWLTQRLSHRLGAEAGSDAGVCANMDFPFPGTLVGRAVAAAIGLAADEDPWRPDRCVWPLIEVIDRHAEDPVLAPLAAHLRAATPEPAPPRRFSVARHLADLFDHYAVHRPELVLGWATGGPSPEGVDPTAAWQAHLWRLLRQWIGVASPAERFAEAARRLVDQPDVLDLPERVSLFGLTRLPASHLEVLQAVAASREVHLFLLHPSGQLWERVAEAEPRPPFDRRRSADPTAQLASNQLLRSWGRDAREMQLVLAARQVTGGEHRPVQEAPATLLGRIQVDVRSDRLPAGEDERLLLAAQDRSLQVHTCHGRARQVEVLRDAILHLLSEDETLEPRDVIVMCPDIETFAPLIYAAFGPDDPTDSQPPVSQGTGTGLPQLRVRLADRSVRQTNPLLGVAAQLLVLAGSRVTGSEVLDLASRPPVARRFRFDQDDLSVFQRWVGETGIRWGLDAAHRRPWLLDGVAANTWQSGLDRLLLGVTMTEAGGRTFGATLPYDDVPSSEVDLAGRVAELIDRLTHSLDSLQGPQPAGTWVEALIEGTELLAVAGPGDQWQHDQLRRVLGEVATDAGQGPDLAREEARDLLAARLQGRPTVANFRTGDLTICTLVPMRSVPHRVVALLGLDDGAFPRHPEIDGDDLLLAEPRVGDRDPRSEDRMLLLDALLAATDHLIVTYSGRDERTNRERPPAVPVAELLDVIDATARCEDGEPARTQVITEHPLQAFDPRNFTAGSAWSYDQVQLAGARASTRRHPVPPWLPEALPPLDEPVLQLDELVRFVEHPVRAFLRRRLGLYLGERGDDLDDALPIDLDALEKWGVGDRLLQARLAGTDADRAAEAERSRGLLPPESLADKILDDICQEVDQLATAVIARGGGGPAHSVDVHLDLPDGRSLIGTVPNRRAATIVGCTYSRLAAKHRLAAWVRFLALSAGRPDLGIRSETIGRGQPHHPPVVARLEPVDATTAQLHLAGIIELYELGMRAPLPLACNTSAAWAEAAFRGKSDEICFSAAKEAWDGGRWDGECSDPEHRYVQRHKGNLLDDTLFRTLARRLWDPLLAHEQIGPAQ